MNRMMFTIMTLSVFALSFTMVSEEQAFASSITTSDTMYTCSSSSGTDNDISITNKTDGQIISSNTLNINGLSSEGCTGLVQDPIFEIWYIVIRDTDSYLATVDPLTGLGSSIGLINERTQSIAFNSTGHLFGWSGQAGTDPVVKNNI